ncbi:MAG: FkbM family methyltransferase [Flavobacteriales bacterium]|nr:FkbM family methyltransferase [Flavobacteriales bacterium]MBK6944681.1 FkbM family methyltransferase [Flavobacteriales bacterium]
MLKKAIRRTLRRILPVLGIRGRHTIADRIGKWAAPDPPIEMISINGVAIEIDHRLSTCRHMYYGIYEEQFLNFLRRTLVPGDVFFDLGANIGYITAVVSGLVKDTGRVISFEPSRICYDQIMRNNPELPTNVQLRNAAIMHESGTFPFMDTPRVISSGFSVLFHERTAGTNDNVYEVETTSLDDAAEQACIDRIACMKIDIEGAEHIAIQGAKKLLSAQRVDHLLVETTNIVDQSRAENKHIVDLLVGHGYEPFLPDRKGRLQPFVIDLNCIFRHDIVWRRKSLAATGN